MNNQVKVGASAVSICALVIALLAIAPSPLARINLVMSAPSFDNETRIAEVRIDNSTYSNICMFNENNTTANVSVGENVIRLQVKVYIKMEYAATSDNAQANTRVYMTIKAPDNSIKYQDYLDNWAGGIENCITCWGVTKRDNTFTSFLLTEGTWTITTTYDVYA